jgi:hypothetical protein
MAGTGVGVRCPWQGKRIAARMERFKEIWQQRKG